MAHELDERFDGTGKAVFSVGEDMWHREGRVLVTAPATVAEALEEAGTNWEVELVPIFTEVSTGGDFVAVEGSQAVRRADNGRALGIVGGKYRPLQNVDAFGILQPLMDQGLATWATAGALRHGRDVWGSVALAVDGLAAEVYAELGLRAYASVHNNHGGNAVGCAMTHATRVVCANTLRYAMGERAGRLSIRHTGAVEAKATAAAMELFAGLLARHTAAAQQYQRLRAHHLDTATFRRLVLDVALPLPQRPAADASARSVALWDTATQTAEQARRELVRLWSEGAGHTGDRTAWEAYNGLVEALDHRPDVFPVRGGSSRLDISLTGRLGDIHAGVGGGVVAVAK